MSAWRPAAEAWVLAGGRSTRMGRDKALVSLSGVPLLVLALEKLRSLPLAPGGAPRIAGSRPDLASYAPVVEDLHPGCGPLGGIEAALAAATQPLNVFLAVDLPWAPGELLAWMMERAAITGALATYPRLRGLSQPLCAVYHRDLLPHLSRALRAGEYGVMRAIENALRELPGSSGSSTQALDAFDLELLAATYPEMLAYSAIPLHRWLDNCNSPQDLASMESLSLHGYGSLHNKCPGR